MTYLDPTLKKIRLLESEELISENKPPESYDNFVREVRDFYKKQGMDVSYELTYKIIDALGIDEAKTKAGASLASRIQKDPNRLLTAILDEKGVTVDFIKKMINNNKNPSGDPDIMQKIDTMVDAMIKAEGHASASHSINTVMSSDLYEIKEFMRRIYEEIQKKQSSGSSAPSNRGGYMGKQIHFIKPDGSAGVGTVLVDSDDPSLSQEYLDSVTGRQKQNTPDTETQNTSDTGTEKQNISEGNSTGDQIPDRVEEVQQTSNTLWIQCDGQIYEVDKSVIIDEALSNRIKNLMRDSELFFKAIDGLNYGGEKMKRKVARSQGGLEYYQDKADEVGKKVGFSDPKTYEYKHKR